MDNKKLTIKEIVKCSIFTAMFIVLSWITIPSNIIPVTLQTLGLFIITLLLGCKKGSLVITIYIILGLIGIPVFSGFTGGIGVFLGPTGGFIIGFLVSMLLGALYETIFKKKNSFNLIFKCILVLFFTYLTGALWFKYIYLHNDPNYTFINVLGIVILPYVALDLIKMFIASIVYAILYKRIDISK